MRKTAAGAVAAVALIAAVALAPPVLAQDRGRVVRPGIQLPAMQAPGSEIGVSVRESRAEELTSANVAVGGVVVEDVREGSPAAQAGLQAGDIIIEFDGERVRGVRHFSRLVVETPPGRAVTASIVRAGARQAVEVTPEAADRLVGILPRVERGIERGLRVLPREFELAMPPLGMTARPRLGVTLVPLTDQLAAYFGVEQGALVSAVEPDSPAARAGIRAGDIITAIDGRAVADPGDVAAELRREEPGSMLEIALMREKSRMSVTATLPERDRSAPSARLPV